MQLLVFCIWPVRLGGCRATGFANAGEGSCGVDGTARLLAWRTPSAGRGGVRGTVLRGHAA